VVTKGRGPAASALISVLLVVAAGCAPFGEDEERDPVRDRYSSADQRQEWTERLRTESEPEPRVAFDRLGRLTSVSGAFRLSREQPAAWISDHGQMLGLPEGATVEAIAREPSYRFNGERDRLLGVQQVFRVEHEGYPFAGREITAVFDEKRDVLLGVYNGFVPPVEGFARARPLDEERAWRVAERQVGSPLDRVSAVQTWFDRSWAFDRVPSTNALHWRLEGTDALGNVRHVFVESATGQVVFATPDRSDFAVRQTHRNDGGFVLWDSQTLPGGCIAGTGACTGRALEDSLLSRDVLPRVVDIWFNLSAGGPGPFVWPFNKQIDNGGQAINAVVTHGGGTCSFPCRIGSTYFFPLDTDTVELDPSSNPSANPPKIVLRAPTTVTPEMFGHEYGHQLLSRLKVMHPGGSDEGKLEPATFTEAMADFIGMVSEDAYYQQKFGCCGTDFQILGTRWTKDGQKFVDYARVSWPLRPGDCAGRGRARFGHALWNAWTEDAYFYGDRPNSTRNATFRAWWIDVMRSFAFVGDFPTIGDFYNATQSRLGGYVLIEAGVSYRLAYELEKLGLHLGGCK
jgi:hypothetical protein